MTLRLLTYNILDGGAGREELITEILQVNQADVILLQEVASRNFVERLAARLGTNYFFAEGNSMRHLALLSRFPLSECRSFHPQRLRHTLMEAQIEFAPRRHLGIFSVHLSAPAFTLVTELYRRLEVRTILKRVAEANLNAFLIAGDFNAIAPNDTVDFKNLPWVLRMSIYLHGGLIFRQAIQAMQRGGMIDGFRRLNPSAPGYTLPASHPNARLDYVFVSRALEKNLCTCNVITQPDAVRRASDHLPVMIELDL